VTPVELQLIADLLRGASGMLDLVLDRGAKLQLLEGAHRGQTAELDALRRERQELRTLVDVLSKRVEQLEPKGL